MFIILFLSLIFTFPNLTWAQNQASVADVTETDKSSEISAPLGSRKIKITLHMMDIVLNDEHRAGVDWSAIVADYHTAAFKKIDNPIWVDKKYRLSSGILSQDDYAVLTDALDAVGAVTSSPEKMIEFELNENQVIDLGEGGTQISLTVKEISEEGVDLTLIPQFDTVLSDQRLPGRLWPKVSLKAMIEKTVMPGSTIVLGSMFMEQEITKLHKFPLLGDLPLLGLVFRSHGRLMQKSEKIIFVTIGQ